MSFALLVIDVQEGLFSPQPMPGDADAVIARINSLAGRARQAGVPVIYIQHQDEELPVDSAPWQLYHPLVTDAGDKRITKTTPDSFLCTPLAALLDSLEVNHLIICGYASEFCVDTTARRAAGLGYQVTLAADAHTTHDKSHSAAAAIRAHHNATLSSISSFGVAIRALPADEIAF